MAERTTLIGVQVGVLVDADGSRTIQVIDEAAAKITLIPLPVEVAQSIGRQLTAPSIVRASSVESLANIANGKHN